MRSLLLLALVTASAPARAGDWKLFLDEDGVKGYSRKIAGSDLLEVRSTIVVNAPIEVVGAVLRDVEGLKRPGTSCMEARFIEKKDRNHYTLYVAYDFPWPLSNRDSVVRVENRYVVDKGRVIADLRGVRDRRVPPRKGFVRITKLRSQFVVEYISRHKTGVVYTSRVDPGGSIPDFLINRANKSGLKDNALDLRRAVKKPEYIRAAASSPDAALVKKVTGDPQQMKTIIENRLREFIKDRALVQTLVADRGVYGSLTRGAGKVGEILLHGWGSRRSKVQAVKVLLRRLLWGHSRDGKAIERLVNDRRLIFRILFAGGGNDEVQAFIARHGASGATKEKGR